MQIKDLLRLAYNHATDNSQDETTQVGALVVNNDGYICSLGTNVFVPGMITQERPLKYRLVEHAEENAILLSAKIGFILKDKILISTWAACPDCARAIYFSGIKKVISHKQCYDRTPDRWKDDINLGLQILKSGGVDYQLYDGKIGGCTNLFNGEEWLP